MLNCGYYITETFRCLAHASGEIRESLGWLEKSPWSGIKPRKLYAILPDQLIRERDGLCAVVLVTCAPIIIREIGQNHLALVDLCELLKSD